MTTQTLDTNPSPQRGGIDWAVFDEGSLFLFLPLTEEAEAHAREMFGAAMTWGPSYVVEHRFAGDIVQALFAEGFRVMLDHREIRPRRARPC